MKLSTTNPVEITPVKCVVQNAGLAKNMLNNIARAKMKNMFLVLVLNLGLALGAFSQNPPNTTLISHWGYGPCWAVTINSDYAFMGSGCVFMIMDYSNPATLEKVGELLLPDNIKSIKISGNYAYVATSKAGLSVIDISNPVDPVKVGSVITFGYAFDITLSGNYAYIANESGMAIISISNPANPQVIGSCSTTGDARGIDINGNYAYYG
jgi:hypothetical protein